MRNLTTHAAALLLAATMAACTPMTAGAETPSLEGTSWVLSSLPGHDLGATQPPTLRFEDGNAGGSDGCNRYSMGYATRGHKLEWTGPGVATQMACPPETMKLAQAFTDAVRGSTSYRIKDGRLELLGDDGKLRATLDAQAATLTGTAWHATGINNGKGAVASVVLGSQVTMVFGTDGRVTGSAGCNSYNAGYEANATQIRFTPAASTRKMCASNDVMQQEQAFLKALESASTLRFEGNQLELRRADGALAIALIRDEDK
jgi:heat shock protein HslJ